MNPSLKQMTQGWQGCRQMGMFLDCRSYWLTNAVPWKGGHQELRKYQVGHPLPGV